MRIVIDSMSEYDFAFYEPFISTDAETIFEIALEWFEKGTSPTLIAADLSLRLRAFGDVRKPQESEAAARRRVEKLFRHAAKK